MKPNYKILFCLQLVLLLPAGLLAAKPKEILSDPNLHVKPQVRTVRKNGYQLTEGGHVGLWLLHVMVRDVFACGASYYQPLYVLTSANCMWRHRKKLNRMSVEYANMEKGVGIRSSLIESVNVPKSYRYPDNYMDIAVIKLRKNLNSKGKHFVSLCQNPLRSYEKLTVVACGMNTDGTFYLANSEDIALMEQSECQPLYEKQKLKISETIACGREINRGRYRMYEFGCPVTNNGDELCGIVAWGPQFGGSHPGFFTDIYQVKGFILNVVNGVNGDSRRLPRTRRNRPKIQRTWER